MSCIVNKATLNNKEAQYFLQFNEYQIFRILYETIYLILRVHFNAKLLKINLLQPHDTCTHMYVSSAYIMPMLKGLR